MTLPSEAFTRKFFTRKKSKSEELGIDSSPFLSIEEWDPRWTELSWMFALIGHYAPVLSYRNKRNQTKTEVVFRGLQKGVFMDRPHRLI